MTTTAYLQPRSQQVKVQRIHHVAYRCRNARETVEFYQKALDMDFTVAIAEEEVPSTKAPDPYMHVFLDAGNGNVLAFFELPNSPEMGRDPNTPDWVQHIAFELGDRNELLEAKERLESLGLDVIGPTDHGIFESIYFRDPNDHRIELTYWKSTDEEMAELARVAPLMLREWSEEGSVPRHAQWLHRSS